MVEVSPPIAALALADVPSMQFDSELPHQSSRGLVAFAFQRTAFVETRAGSTETSRGLFSRPRHRPNSSERQVCDRSHLVHGPACPANLPRARLGDCGKENKKKIQKHVT